MFIREVIVDPFMSIFMAHGREKEQEKYGKSEELTSGVWGRSRQTSKYFDDVKCHTYFGVLSCFNLKDVRVE